MGGGSNGEQLSPINFFSIMVDTVPPTITPLSFRNDMTKSRSMSFKLYDNLSTPAKVDNLKYNAYIDGQWVLMEYDKKLIPLDMNSKVG